jgi:hypothetical protein
VEGGDPGLESARADEVHGEARRGGAVAQDGADTPRLGVEEQDKAVAPESRGTGLRDVQAGGHGHRRVRRVTAFLRWRSENAKREITFTDGKEYYLESRV